MALVRRCPACGVSNPVSANFCTCKTPLFSVARTEEAAPPSETAVAPAGVECPRCGQRFTGGETECVYCSVLLPVTEPAPGGRPASPVAPSGIANSPSEDAGATRLDAPAVTIEWPWGACSVHSRLVIGRDARSPLAAQLASYENVSGVHAEIRVSHEGVFLIDVGTQGTGSSNFTFVNEQKLVPNIPFRLANGDRLRFARDLQATARIHS